MDTDTPYTELYRDTVTSVVSVYLAVATADGRPRLGTGSGFVYDEFGYVVTNAHVVGDAAEVELRRHGRPMVESVELGARPGLEPSARRPLLTAA